MATYNVRFEENDNLAAPNNRQRREAKDIIEDNLPTFIDRNSRSGTLKSTRLVRLYLQGQFDENGIRYANLQIQLNATTASDGKTDETGEELDDESKKEGVDVADGNRPKRTTIAIALMPCGEEIPEDIMKEAFNGSLDYRKKATIFKLT